MPSGAVPGADRVHDAGLTIGLGGWRGGAVGIQSAREEKRVAANTVKTLQQFCYRPNTKEKKKHVG